MRIKRQNIALGIVIFWATWLPIVLASNVCDGLRQIQVLPPQWTFVSGNYAFMKSVTSRRQCESATPLLFVGVLAWESVAAGLFVRAAYLIFRQSTQSRDATRIAFAAAIALWAAFLLADEILIVYDVEATHFRLFIAQLLSLMYVDSPHDD